VQAQEVIAHTKKWIENVVIAHNFCPFASRVFLNDAIHYEVVSEAKNIFNTQHFSEQIKLLDEQSAIATSFIIYPNAYLLFSDYLELLKKATAVLKRNKKHLQYQLASFHPQYLFEGEPEDSASHYTNRSPYAMLHILRQNLLNDVVEKYPDVALIPAHNIAFTQQKGVAYMQTMLAKCFK
jgi:uncharacterized protein